MSYLIREDVETGTESVVPKDVVAKVKQWSCSGSMKSRDSSNGTGVGAIGAGTVARVCKCTKSPTYVKNSEPDGDADKLHALLQEQPDLLQKQLEIEIAESGDSMNSHECGRTAHVDAATNREAADKKTKC
jgi:hypothetical protein